MTIDRNLEHQQNLKKFSMGFIILRVKSNEISSCQPLCAQLAEAVEMVKPGQVIHLAAPDARA